MSENSSRVSISSFGLSFL